jgi:hypothetical protein
MVLVQLYMCVFMGMEFLGMCAWRWRLWMIPILESLRISFEDCMTHIYV